MDDLIFPSPLSSRHPVWAQVESDDGAKWPGLVIETGNPGDTERFIPMLDRHIEHYGHVPRQIAADGGYASVANLNDAQAKGG